MNVIITNKFESLLGSVQIDVIKSLNGVFTVEDLAGTFKSFFYNKMIIDITALENYDSVETMQKLAMTFDTSKLILLLDDSGIVNSPAYLSTLVSLGIFNFTKSVDNIPFLIENPNQYKDVARFHQLNSTTKSGGLFNSNDDAETETVINAFSQKIIGVYNLTDHAGATTFTYLLKKHAEKLYKTKAVQIGQYDFAFFNDDGLDYINDGDLRGYIDKHSDLEVIFVDMVDKKYKEFCSDTIFLIEPGLIQLNRLIRDNNRVFEDISGEILVLNRSVLSDQDVRDFEKESKSKVFYNMPNIDDKLDNIGEVNDFLAKLGLSRLSSEPKEEKNKGFSLFH